MPAETPPEMSPAKVRIGLAVIGIVLAVALLMVVVIDSAVGKAVMFAIAVTALVRAFMLYRSLRREQPAR